MSSGQHTDGGSGDSGGNRRRRSRGDHDHDDSNRRSQSSRDVDSDDIGKGGGVDTTVGPIAHVAFRGKRLEAFHNSKKLDLRVGDYVIVEAERGVDLGWVAICEGVELKRRHNQPLRKLQRHASVGEIERIPILRKEDQEALDICRDRAANFNLEMKVIDAETQFDGNRVTFYFTAEHRVDFRELVRDLASIFRTRIELRQVGARDAARRCDGMGPCGRQLCCTTCLREFEPVTLRMAKDQQLSLNPAKISGSCGRLMCCLVYECAAYQEASGQAPRIGSQWRYEGRSWRVDSLDLGNNRIFLRNQDDSACSVDLAEFREGAQSISPAHTDKRRDPSAAGANETDSETGDD